MLPTLKGYYFSARKTRFDENKVLGSIPAGDIFNSSYALTPDHTNAEILDNSMASLRAGQIKSGLTPSKFS